MDKKTYDHKKRVIIEQMEKYLREKIGEDYDFAIAFIGPITQYYGRSKIIYLFGSPQEKIIAKKCLETAEEAIEKVLNSLKPKFSNEFYKKIKDALKGFLQELILSALKGA